jgi:hypothetical protein
VIPDFDDSPYAPHSATPAKGVREKVEPLFDEIDRLRTRSNRFEPFRDLSKQTLPPR